jgi:tetratricopeptide (TPR) repeat protein
MKHLRILLAAGCAAMLLAGPLRAADGDLEQARQHAAKAKVHYDLGEFERAAEEYILVYRLRPLPALLFNIAQSYRQAGQYEKAKQFYQSYLRENPDAQTSAAVKKALKEIDELQVKERQAKNGPPTGVKQPPDTSLPIKPTGPAATPPPPAPPAATASQTPATTPSATPAKATEPAKVAVANPVPQAPPKAVPAVAVTPSAESRSSAPVATGGSSSARTAAWIAGGAAVALLGGGGLFTMKAASADSDLQAGSHTRAEADSLMSTSNSNHKLGALLLGAGLAAAATSAVLFLAF